ncbi:MAG: hypothetical protein ACH36C_04020 [Ilumatobacteraceae bacterium]
MNNKSSSTRFLQTIGAYGCALFIGVYLAAAYSSIPTRAVFIAIPVITLKIARVRSRQTSRVYQFPNETQILTTESHIDEDFAAHCHLVDLISSAS